MHAALADAGLERRSEIVAAPFSDPRFAVGRYIWRHHIAERCLDRPAARKGFPAAWNGMAGRAVCHDRQILALLDQAKILFVSATASLVASTGKSDTCGGDKLYALMHE